jgi:hypothetical protein
MSPVAWLIINWHWAWLLFIILIALLFGVVIINGDWLD